MSSLQALLQAFASARPAPPPSSAPADQTRDKDATRRARPLPPHLTELWKRVDTFRASHHASLRTTRSDEAQSNTFNVVGCSTVVGAEGEASSPLPSLGLLFIIIDDFPNEFVWRAWLAQQDASHEPVRVWFHAKYPDRVRSDFVRQRLVRSFHLRPEWGSVELTKTMALMLREAMGDAPRVHKFAFASESCVPLLPLPDALAAMHQDGVHASWMSYRADPNNGFAQQHQWDVLEAQCVPATCVAKADQWLLLSRRHVAAVLQLLTETLPAGDMTDGEQGVLSAAALEAHALFRVFQAVRASDEVFFPTLLALCLLPPPATASVGSTPLSLEAAFDAAGIVRRRLTYCDWSESARNPKTFATLDRGAVATAKQERAIFFRKIALPSVRREVLAEWAQLVYGPARCAEVVDSMQLDVRGEPPHKRSRGDRSSPHRDR